MCVCVWRTWDWMMSRCWRASMSQSHATWQQRRWLQLNKRCCLDCGLCLRHTQLDHQLCTQLVTFCRVFNYRRQGGYVFVVVCLSVCLFVSNFAQKLRNGFAWNFQWRLERASEQMIKFWWRSGSGINIMTLLRRALVEVCTVPVLLVN